MGENVKEIIALGQRIKARKERDIRLAEKEEYNRLKKEVDGAYNKICAPIAKRMLKEVQEADAKIKAAYPGRSQMSRYCGDGMLGMANGFANEPHTLVHGYTPENEAKLGTARADADKKIDKLNVAFDTFEMDVLTEGADGALKVFIESIKGI